MKTAQKSQSNKDINAVLLTLTSVKKRGGEVKYFRSLQGCNLATTTFGLTSFFGTLICKINSVEEKASREAYSSLSS